MPSFTPAAINNRSFNHLIITSMQSKAVHVCGRAYAENAQNETKNNVIAIFKQRNFFVNVINVLTVRKNNAAILKHNIIFVRMQYVYTMHR